MEKKRLVLILIIGGLAVGCVFFGFKATRLGDELAEAKNEISSFNKNEKVLAFAGLFIEEVLKADKEVDFETRLRLENAVRDIKDEELLIAWNNFVKSQNENEAQAEVKNLLELLFKKIQ